MKSDDDQPSRLLAGSWLAAKLRLADKLPPLASLQTSSRVLQVCRSVKNRFARVVANSRLAQLGSWLQIQTYQSWLYRWLTAAPEPDVVVIDLRDTATVGPLIAVLDWVVKRGGTHWEASLLGSGFEALHDGLAPLLRDSYVGRGLQRIVAPPSDREPPTPTEMPTNNRTEEDST